MNDAAEERFPLAPMTSDLRVMTWVLAFLPLGLGALLSVLPKSSGPVAAIVDDVRVGVFGFLALLLLSVPIVFRPRAFEVHPGGFWIHWPLRSRFVAKGAVVGARVVTAPDFRREHGLGMRIGVGGFFGGFGLLKTSTTTFSMWISRTDRFVLVELRDARPLLISPDRPEVFVAAIERITRHA